MKSKTRDQVEGMKEKAARFSRDVLDDEDKAEEFEGMSVEDYAERKRIALLNPRRIRNMPKNQNLREQVEQLQSENQELREVVEDYETRFDDIASSLPETDEEEPTGDDDQD